MAMLTTPRTQLAHDMQMRYSPFLPPGEHSSLCRNGCEQAQRKGSADHGGDADQSSSANSHARYDERQVRANQTRKKTWKLPQIQYIVKVVGFPVSMQHQVATAPVRRTTDVSDSDVQTDDPWSSHRPSTLKGTGTSWLRYNTRASNTVVNRTDSNLATKKVATKRFTQAVAEPIMASSRGPTRRDQHEARRNEEGCLRQKGHDDEEGCLDQRG